MHHADKLALYHRIGFPAYHAFAIVLAFICPFTRESLLLLLITYAWMSFGISVGYHRLFSHRAFRASRGVTFIIAVMGGLAGQGAIRRWVGHHRQHHQYTDKVGDPHSPHVGGFWYSHMSWRFDPKSYQDETNVKKVWAEWTPELILLDRLIPALFLIYPVFLFLIGGLAAMQWACFVPIVLLWHITFTVNSVSHRFGSRIFNTPDQSHNSLWLSILMWGEGWHNNHHAAPKNARYGVRWYQIDLGFLVILLLQKLGLASQVVNKNEASIRASLRHGQL